MTAINECWGSGGDRLGLSDDRKESDGGLGKETKEKKENRLPTTTLLASIEERLRLSGAGFCPKDRFNARWKAKGIGLE